MTVERGEGFIHSSDVRPLPCTPIMICDGQINGQTRPDGEIFVFKKYTPWFAPQAETAQPAIACPCSPR